MAAGKIRPLITSYEWPPECGGGGRVAQSLVDGLRNWGHAPIVHDNTDGHFLTFPARSHAEIHNLTKDESPDVLHGHFSLPTSLFLPQVSRKYGVPLVITVMGSDVYNPERFRRIRPVLDRVNSWILDRADCVVAPSNALRNRVEDLTDTPIKVIPHGIETSQYDWQVNQLAEPINILTVSRFTQGKNIELAINAVKKLRDKYDMDVVHRIVGDGSMRSDIVAQHASKPWLELPGWDEDVQSHYQWGDIFYLPSEWEAFGLVFLEAIASGLPCVTTPDGGQAEIVTDDVGYTAPPRLADQVDALNFVVQWYHDLQTNTQNYVSDWYSKREMTRQYNNLYLKLC